MKCFWKASDKNGAQAELGEDNKGVLMLTVADTLESAYVDLDKASAHDLFDALGNYLGVFTGSARSGEFTLIDVTPDSLLGQIIEQP